MGTDRGLSGPHLARLLGAWRSGRPGYVALGGALRLLVLDGRLPLRTRLPGERELATALGVSRTTTGAAYAALGLPRLRAAIAAPLDRRGVPTDPAQVLVTSGAQHALSLVARML